MAINTALFSSKNTEWETPRALFSKLNEEFDFFMDLAATRENAKCFFFYTKRDDALQCDWKQDIDLLYGSQHISTCLDLESMCSDSKVCWCNPPYGRNIGKWIEKAHLEAGRGVTTVMLLPARTDTRWFHRYIYGQYEVRFLQGRLTFQWASSPAPFPSMIVIFRDCIHPVTPEMQGA
jgi:site-specific DNA-methyltransferase (adenine-specific)